MRNNWAIWTGAAVVLWFGFLRGVKAAKVTFDRLRIIGVGVSSILLQIAVKVSNPTLLDLVVQNIRGDVYIQGIPVAVVNYPVNQRIRPFASSVFRIQIEAFSDKIGEAVWANIQTGDIKSLNVKFDGFVTIKDIDIPISRTFTYEEIFRA